MSRELIGVVTKPQALKGQFRIKPQINNFKAFKKLSSLYIDNKEYTLEQVSIRDAFVVVKLQGVDSCEHAELFRNKQVFADIDLPIETHFDLEGFEAILDKEKIGTVTEINNFGAKDIATIKGKLNIMIPLIDELIVSIDEDKKEITMNKNIFEQVAVYED